MVKELTYEYGGHEFDHQSGTTSFFSLCVGRTVDELSISAPPTPYYHFYARVSCPLCVGRTVDELSISPPPTPYYYFYARVSCRVCIVPKCAKAMEYLSSWA